MSNWIDSGGNSPSQFGKAYLGQRVISLKAARFRPSLSLACASIQQGDVDRIQPVLHDVPQPTAAPAETGKSLMPKWNAQRQRGS